MTQIPDAPYIRAAETSGYPVDSDDDAAALDCGDCPTLCL